MNHNFLNAIKPTNPYTCKLTNSKASNLQLYSATFRQISETNFQFIKVFYWKVVTWNEWTGFLIIRQKVIRNFNWARFYRIRGKYDTSKLWFVKGLVASTSCIIRINEIYNLNNNIVNINYIEFFFQRVKRTNNCKYLLL